MIEEGQELALGELQRWIDVIKQLMRIRICIFGENMRSLLKNLRTPLHLDKALNDA